MTMLNVRRNETYAVTDTDETIGRLIYDALRNRPDLAGEAG